MGTLVTKEHLASFPNALCELFQVLVPDISRFDAHIMALFCQNVPSVERYGPFQIPIQSFA